MSRRPDWMACPSLGGGGGRRWWEESRGPGDARPPRDCHINFGPILAGPPFRPRSGPRRRLPGQSARALEQALRERPSLDLSRLCAVPDGASASAGASSCSTHPTHCRPERVIAAPVCAACFAN